jgi:hypothetical protein
MDAILTWIGDNYPVFIPVITAALLGWWGQYVWGRFVRVEKWTKAAPCKNHIDDISVLKKERENVINMAMNINIIAKWIMKRDPKTIDALAKCSPYYVTPYGHILLEQSGAKGCIDNNFDFFKNYINAQKPETEYDVENIATFSITAGMTQGLLNPVKDFLYHSPDKVKVAINGIEKEMEISELLLSQLMGIYVRDKYLELFPDTKEKLYTE